MKIYNCGINNNKNKPRIYYNLFNRQDKRFFCITYEKSRYVFGEGFKITIAMTPKLFLFERYFKEFRIVFVFFSIHFKS